MTERVDMRMSVPKLVENPEFNSFGCDITSKALAFGRLYIWYVYTGLNCKIDDVGRYNQDSLCAYKHYTRDLKRESLNQYGMSYLSG